MGLSTSAKNNMLDCGLRNQTPSIWMQYGALFKADPDSTLGTSYEISGGSPAYARKALTWNAASNGSMTHNGTPVFDVPSGATITHVGFFSASSGGTYFGMADVTDETFGAQGTYTLTSITVSLT